MGVRAQFDGVDLVLAAFGEWPTFHDSEVLSVLLERYDSAPTKAPKLTMRVRVRRYQEIGQGTAKYELSLTHDYVVEFCFEAVTDLELGGFNGQNVLDSITLTEADSEQLLHVDLDPIYGVGATWKCAVATVKSVAPMRTDGAV